MSAGDARRRLEQALSEHGCSVRGNAAQCPAHEDRSASLSVGQGRDGAVVKCHVGCATDAVLEALGMSAADLFDEPIESGPRRQVVAEYAYTGEDGRELFRKVRYEPKDFRQYRIVNGRQVWSLGDVRRVLYRLPQVLEAARSGRVIYLAEGEKDVHAIEAAGAVATCNFDGAAKAGQRPKWRPEYGDALKGADVVVVADRDEAGRAHAAAILADLGGKARSVRVVEAAEGKDAADHLGAGYGLGDFAPVELSAPDMGSAAEAGPVAERLGQLRAALLDSAALDAVPPPEAVIDGLLYRNGVAWLYGKPGTYKSIIALDWACCVSVGLPWQEHETVQGPVLYVYIEGMPGLRQRVRAWEDRARCKTGVAFLPIAVQLLNPVDLAAFTALVAELGAVLVVIDTQARVTVGVEENSAMEMGRVVDAAGVIYRAVRSCVLVIHHEARSGETPRGSIAIDGAATSLFRAERDDDRITLKNPRQRDTAEADDLVLYAVEHLGSVVVANSRDRWEFAAPKADSGTKILAIMREVFAGISASPSQLIDASGLPKTTTYRALSSLVIEGMLVNTGTNNRPRYELPKENFPLLPIDASAGTSQIPAPGGSFRTPGDGNLGTRSDDQWPEGSYGEAS